MNSKFLVICVVFALAVGAIASYTDDFSLIESRVILKQRHALNGLSEFRLRQLGYKHCANFGEMCNCSGIMTYGHKGHKDSRMIPFDKHNAHGQMCVEKLNPHHKPSAPAPGMKREIKSITVDVDPNPAAALRDFERGFQKDEKVGKWDIHIMKLPKPSVEDAHAINSNPTLIEVNSEVVPNGFEVVPNGFCMCKHRKDIIAEKKAYIQQNAEIDAKFTRVFEVKSKLATEIPRMRKARLAAQKSIYEHKLRVKLVRQAALKLKRKVERSRLHVDSVRMKKDLAKARAARYIKRIKRVKDNLFVLKDEVRNRKVHKHLLAKEAKKRLREEQKAKEKAHLLAEETEKVTLSGASPAIVSSQKDLEVRASFTAQQAVSRKNILDMKLAKIQFEFKKAKKSYKRQLSKISKDRIKRNAAVREADLLRAKVALVKAELKDKKALFHKIMEQKEVEKKKVKDAKRKYKAAKKGVRNAKKVYKKSLKKYGRSIALRKQNKIGFACCQQHMCNLIMNRDHNPFNPSIGTYLSVHDPHYNTKFCALKLPKVARNESAAFCQSDQQIRLHIKAMADRRMRSMIQGNDLCSPTKLPNSAVEFNQRVIKDAKTRKTEAGKKIARLLHQDKILQASVRDLKRSYASALRTTMRLKHKLTLSKVVIKATAKVGRKNRLDTQLTALTIAHLKRQLAKLSVKAQKQAAAFTKLKNLQLASSKHWQSASQVEFFNKRVVRSARKLQKTHKKIETVQERLNKKTIHMRMLKAQDKKYSSQFSQHRDAEKKIKEDLKDATKRFKRLSKLLAKMRLDRRLLHKRITHLTKVEVKSIMKKSTAENKIVISTIKSVVLEAKDCMGNHDWTCYKGADYYFMARVNPKVCEVECYSKDGVACKETVSLTECEGAISKAWHGKSKPVSCHGHYDSKSKPWCRVVRDANDKAVDVGKEYDNSVGECNHKTTWQCLDGSPVRYNQKLCQPECSSTDGKNCIVENSQEICQRKLSEYMNTRVITCGGRQENDRKRHDGIHHSRWAQASCTKINRLFEIQTKEEMDAAKTAVQDAKMAVNDAEKDVALKRIERKEASKNIEKAEKKLFKAKAFRSAMKTARQVRMSFFRPSKSDSKNPREDPFQSMNRIKASAKTAARREKYSRELTNLTAKYTQAKTGVVNAQAMLDDDRTVFTKKKLAHRKAQVHLNLALSDLRTAARSYSVMMTKAAARTERWKRKQQKKRNAAILKAKYALLNRKERARVTPEKMFSIGANDVKLHQEIFTPVPQKKRNSKWHSHRHVGRRGRSHRHVGRRGRKQRRN